LSYLNDTIEIKEVVISKRGSTSESSVYKKGNVDSLTLTIYSHNSMAEILTEYSGIPVKSYGMGGSALPSFRGTGSSHTQITWNGININNPMLGQTDLSILPVGMIDDIQVCYGGASMAINSGGIGGSINLETKPYWKKETIISINQGVESFGRYSGLVKVKTGSANFQTVTKAFLQNSENAFRYLNTESSSVPVWEKRENNQVRQQGFIQELYYRKSNHILSARVWYQSADRNLPGSMLTQNVNSSEKQTDESLRTMLKYDVNDGRIDYSISAVYMISRLDYTNRLVSIDSRNISETVVLNTGFGKKVGELISLKFHLNEELSIVKTNNYADNTGRNTVSFTGIIERPLTNRVDASLLIREILNNNELLIPDFSSGIQFRLTDDREYFLKANFNRNSKVPAMNDMYWVPGGNTELKNEYAYIYELTYEMKQKISLPLNLGFDLTLFRNDIKDMIQWHPGKYSYWTADNIKNVKTMGIESSVMMNYKLNHISSGLKANYSFTKANSVVSSETNDASSGKQLIYVPQNQANVLFNLKYKNTYTSWIANMIGKRYITADNSKFLPGYFLNSVLVGIRLKLKSHSLDTSFNIDNIFNVSYETVAYYPLPGRAYSLKFSIQINK
jgi:iron complex outermembrane receptor protein